MAYDEQRTVDAKMRCCLFQFDIVSLEVMKFVIGELVIFQVSPKLVLQNLIPFHLIQIFDIFN